ncbi:trypsin-like peptidase domain-containing protein [Azospirillum sp. YIM B02556]|uniref:Trypsin-like peptidase domain-containing protein n=1 Tax=Azospirillum endophyticum TaxID=2800326 RepID=A0ABS1F244_9PROT|nr:serine protease [Azospirillum endophyticum]MBK1837483.1 trypsin-like peptidase domain-containing protein [Azospirillum endophyticum]
MSGGVLPSLAALNAQLRGWLIMILATSLCTPEAGAATPAEVTTANQDSVVFIESTAPGPDGNPVTETGTGFIVSRRGYVLTANHLLSANQSAKLVGHIKSRFAQAIPVQRLTIPGCCDLALLSLPSGLGPFKPVTLGNPDSLKVGDPVITLGFALDTDLSATAGILGAQGGNTDGLWRITNPVTWGDSGSPVFDSKGRVVGLVKGGVAGAAGVNFIIPLNFACGLLLAANVPCLPPTGGQQGVAPIALSDGRLVMPWPLSEITSAELRLRNIDDYADVYVNGTHVINQAVYGQILQFSQFTSLLKVGENEIRVVIKNGQYGGCGAALDVHVNGEAIQGLQRAWTVPIENAFIGGLCVDDSILFMIE